MNSANSKVSPSYVGSLAESVHLRENLAQFAEDYKSAQRLSDETLILGKRSLECYVIELSSDDLKIPRPYPFTD
jgi:hypothetical protein